MCNSFIVRRQNSVGLCMHPLRGLRGTRGTLCNKKQVSVLSLSLSLLDQEKLVYLVHSVVLTSGPDEALMCRCARVMADWSSDPKFAKEMGTKEAAGKSLAALMRSVSPKTKACF